MDSHDAEYQGSGRSTYALPPISAHVDTILDHLTQSIAYARSHLSQVEADLEALKRFQGR